MGRSEPLRWDPAAAGAWRCPFRAFRLSWFKRLFFLIGLLSDARKESLTEEGWAVIRSQPKAQCTERKSPNEAAHEEKEPNQLNQLNTPKPGECFFFPSGRTLSSGGPQAA